MTNDSKLDKGGYMEEALRAYFLDLGYFVVRGIKFRYQNFDVTDVDLWLYMRPSTMTRERVNVDIKNKKTPQAIERIFWAKGLQQVLGLDKCMVATTDTRPAVLEFGQSNEVIVLDGSFLSRLNKYKNSGDRLSEEEFTSLILSDNIGELKGEWRKRVDNSKSTLLSQLNYSGCNYWLAEAAKYMNDVVIEYKRKEIACRLSYLNLSFFLVCLDYVFKDLIFFESDERANALRDGFRHGALGKMGMDKIIATSIALIEQYTPRGHELSSVLRKNVSAAFDQIKVEILKEYYNRPDVIRNLFANARRFETLAYQRHFTEPGKLDAELQSIIGVTLDYVDIERRIFFDAFLEQSTLSIIDAREKDVS
jgi:hypothetical protein